MNRESPQIDSLLKYNIRMQNYEKDDFIIDLKGLQFEKFRFLFDFFFDESSNNEHIKRKKKFNRNVKFLKVIYI